MTPPFADAAARRRWTLYFAEVDRILARAGADAGEIRSDLQRHICDSVMARADEGGELERLEAALRRLGRPADYLRPLVADHLPERDTRTYRPHLIARALFHRLLAGTVRSAAALAIGCGYVLLAILVAIALAKPLWRDHVGLFVRTDGAMAFGILADTNHARELLGYWAIPIVLLVSAALYLGLTQGLRAVRRRF